MPYAGELTSIPAGAGTLVSDNNQAKRHTDLVVAEGITSSGGAWTREPGATPYSATGLVSGFQLSGITSNVSSTIPLSNFQWVSIAASFKVLGTPSFDRLLDSNGSVDIVGGTVFDIYNTGIDTVNGAMIAVCVALSGTANVLSVVDDAGNTYSRALLHDGPGAPPCAGEIWYALNTSPLANGEKVRVTLSGSRRGYMNAMIFRGVQLASALDLTVAGAGTALGDGAPVGFASAMSSPVAEATEVVVGLQLQRTRKSATFSLASGWTLADSADVQFTDIYDGISAALAYQVFTPATSGKKINVMIDYWPTLTAQRLLALGSDGVLYKSSGGAFTALTMATTMSSQPGSMIVVGGQERAGNARKAFCFDNGTTKIQTLTADGVVTTDFGNGWNPATNIPADWTSNSPRGGIVHKARLWCWAPANAPHCIYASQVKDHENFKNAVGGSLEYVETIGEGTGLKIAAAASFKGMLFVFKYPRGVYFLDDTDVDYLNWRWNIVSDAVGVADTPHSVIVTDDDVIFCDPNGHWHFLSAITQQGVETGDATSRLNLTQWTEEHVQLSRLPWMSSVWYPAKQMAMVGLSSLQSITNNLRVYMDFSTSEDDSLLRISYTYRDVTRALAVRRDEVDGVQRPIFTEEDGIVWKMDRASPVKTGYPNAGQARYRYVATDLSHVDASLESKRKIFDALAINFDPVGAWDLNIDVFIDGQYSETLHFPMGSSGLILGTMRFGQRFGGTGTKTLRRRMIGSGYFLALEGWIQGEGRTFVVNNHIVSFRVGGEEQR